MTQPLDLTPFREFQPTTLGLPENFLLTSFAQLPKNELTQYINEISHSLSLSKDDLDSSIVPSPIPGYSLVSSTDFFTPSVCDPEQQGRIAAANVLSDLFAVGAQPLNALMIVGASTECTDHERTTATSLMMKGFASACAKLGCKVSGGQTVLNPEFLIGGTVMSVTLDSTLVKPTGARLGDVLIQTKPLGTQVISNVAQWLEHVALSRKGYENVSQHALKSWSKLCEVYGEEEFAKNIARSRDVANSFMARMNNVAAEVMVKYHGSCCSDITGFGLIGHANNLAELSSVDVDFVIDKLYCHSGAVLVNNVIDFGLSAGTSPETSGGLLFAVREEDAGHVVKELKERGEFGEVVGRIVKGKKRARLSDDVEVIEV
ncbi:hypothetical protein GEMRC1_012428 [Eukaryota sp. GEM-RC1]